MILNYSPLRNEPGLEDSSKEEIEIYNEILRWHNYSFSIYKIYDCIGKEYEYFRPIMGNLFIVKYKKFMKVFTKLSKLDSVKLECKFFKMIAKPNYKLLTKMYTERFKKFKKEFKKEDEAKDETNKEIKKEVKNGATKEFTKEFTKEATKEVTKEDEKNNKEKFKK
jgi:hypothetical protein